MFDPTDPFYTGGALPTGLAFIIGVGVILLVGWLIGRREK